MKKGLTIGIVTRKRPELLVKCLKSIAKQTQLIQEVIVVDNDYRKSSESTVAGFKSKLRIKYLVEPKIGISYGRNKVLDWNKTKYLGFVDDDCVLDSNWAKEGLKTIKRYKLAYVLGKTELLNKNSMVAQARFYYYKHWFKSQFNFNRKKVSSKSLDTKNVIFDFEMINKKKVRFDERFAVTSIGGGEDMDMDLQLEKLNLNGGYVEKMKLKHQEPERIKILIKKAYWSGRASYLLAKKWQLESEFESEQFDWKVWWNNFWIKPYVNKELKKKTDIKKLWFHVLIKLYDRAWIQGYIVQRRRGFI